MRSSDDDPARVQVKTPEPAMDLMLNRWLLYQVLACRVWARSAFYQSGGAYGFRDQLQDVMALSYSAPKEARAQILRAAARQFEEGDVQHWWHPPTGIGVRTRISDDLYFLPLVVHHHVTTTGDMQLLDEFVPFIKSPVLRADQEEDPPSQSSASSPGRYEHATRWSTAIGSNLLMGTGTERRYEPGGRRGQGRERLEWLVLRHGASQRWPSGVASAHAGAGNEPGLGWPSRRMPGTALVPPGVLRRRHPSGSAQNEECQIDATPRPGRDLRRCGPGRADRQ